jgi:hypothetical protein
MDNLDDQERGLYNKFVIVRIRDEAHKHTDCEYFTLDLTHDKHAEAAIMAYCSSLTNDEEYPFLASDLREKLHIAWGYDKAHGLFDAVLGYILLNRFYDEHGEDANADASVELARQRIVEAFNGFNN